VSGFDLACIDSLWTAACLSVADKAEDLGDQIGPSPERAADACYRTAGLLRAHAAEIAPCQADTNDAREAHGPF
jgi:hypothetical protein